jgi:hypothetical protein
VQEWKPFKSAKPLIRERRSIRRRSCAGIAVDVNQKKRRGRKEGRKEGEEAPRLTQGMKHVQYTKEMMAMAMVMVMIAEQSVKWAKEGTGDLCINGKKSIQIL